MATKKPAPKRAPKPAPKPVPKPAEKNLKPRAVPFQTPQPAPLDLVRNPNFSAAMAQQNYANLMRDQQARLAAGQGTQPAGNQDFIDSRDSNRAYTADMVDYIDPATGERTSRTRGVVPAPGSKFVPANGNAPSLMPIPQGPQVGGGNQDIIDFRKRIYDDLTARQGQPFLPDGGMGGARNFDIDYIEGGQRNAPMTPTPSQMAAYNNLLQQQGAMASQYAYQQSPQSPQVDGSMVGKILTPIPQGQQMPVPDQQQGARADQYQNFLQQGLANYAAQNYPQQQQGAMGAQAAQNYVGGLMPSPAIPSRKPIGGVTAQPRGLPRPRQPKGFRSPIGRSAF